MDDVDCGVGRQRCCEGDVNVPVAKMEMPKSYDVQGRKVDGAGVGVC